MHVRKRLASTFLALCVRVHCYSHGKSNHLGRTQSASNTRSVAFHTLLGGPDFDLCKSPSATLPLYDGRNAKLLLRRMNRFDTNGVLERLPREVFFVKQRVLMPRVCHYINTMNFRFGMFDISGMSRYSKYVTIVNYFVISCYMINTYRVVSDMLYNRST